MYKRILSVALLSLVFTTAFFGQASDTRPADKAATRLMPIGDVREGMRGIAKTVFRGSEPEEFNVEILGVVPGAIGPRQDLIIGRLSGGGADRTSVFAGMSGSPVYIDGKLVGAISYSFPFSKEPICGITPIQQMIDIFEKKQLPAAPPAAKAVSFAEITAAEWETEPPRTAAVDSGLLSGFSQSSALMAVAGQAFRPIATPVTFNGFTQRTLDAFAPQLLSAGLVPVAAVGGSAAITPLKIADAKTLVGGASVSMQLARGDYSLAAAGTVTWRDGDKIYAFGHPFMSLGTSDLPMSESRVVTVVPNVNNSFKLAVPDAMVGSMMQDRATGVFGRLGVAPKMIPVRIRMETSRGQKQTLNFEVARDEYLTPLLLNIAVYNSLVAQERGLGESTVQVNGEIRIKDNAPIKLHRRFAGGQASQLAASSVAAPVSLLLKSGFDDVEISGLDIDLTAADGGSVATLERMSVDRTRLRPGETAEVRVYARSSTGRILVEKVFVKIPVDTPAGPLTITVADGAALQQASATQQFVPSGVADLIDIVNKVRLPDRLYLQMFRTSNGAIIGSNEMPNLPPSVLATLNNDRTVGGVKPAVQTVIAENEIASSELVISGQQSLSIEIVR